MFGPKRLWRGGAAHCYKATGLTVQWWSDQLTARWEDKDNNSVFYSGKEKSVIALIVALQSSLCKQPSEMFLVMYSAIQTNVKSV